MNPTAWIGSNFDEVYLAWEKPHKADDPNPVPLYHHNAVQSLQSERDAAVALAERYRTALEESIKVLSDYYSPFEDCCYEVINIAQQALEGGGK